MKPKLRVGLLSFVSVTVMGSGAAAQIKHRQVALAPSPAEVVVDFVTPFRDRTLELLDDQDHLMEVLKQGRERASEVAEATLRDVYQRVGFVAPSR